ncbi:hypothetical protein MKW98_004179 [Papaver atlanticum]|uniref:Uncharacterized protein n=1 Tax=Papaver atlanticum TaxID=357466 RepID=A0AAD4XQD7_9MAGN|nr:hypothetical protein MKW98_004179 [Papaver atlanticum]
MGCVMGCLTQLVLDKVVTLLAMVIEHLVTGETTQMASTSEQRCSMDQYMQQTTSYKTASLIANSCKAIALLPELGITIDRRCSRFDKDISFPRKRGL